jgi:3-oxoacyl-[acyl-carrier protein] reductase
MCRAIGPGMAARKRGAIVNMSSLAAWNGGGPGAGAYAMAKGAIVSMTKALAKELAPHGVRVNCVAPGLIGDTAFHGRFTPPAAFESAIKNVLLGRAGTPDEVASVVAFLASSDSSFMTGETIEINGGMNMR